MVISEKIEAYTIERPHYTPGKALWTTYISKTKQKSTILNFDLPKYLSFYSIS